ncbi:MAG: integrase arm-type DNA-binding domain-containing protein [Burkholderiales bacterium]|nr:integrase arm-type DNA-binding domain-containing protein [Burkholderiales bacterium]
MQSALRTASDSATARKISDGGGLLLDVRPSRVGWWRFRYRIAGVEKMLSLGVYPDVSLREARSRRDDARRLVSNGIDPSKQRQSVRAAELKKALRNKQVAEGRPIEGSFEYLARRWVEEIHRSKVSKGHADRTLVRFENDAFPLLGSRPIAEIDPPELLRCLRLVESRGALETAHRLKDSCGQVFRYAIASGECARNPAADLREALRPVQTKHFAALLEPSAVGKLMVDIAEYRGSAVTRAALMLSPLLLLRPGELRHLEWEWMDETRDVLVLPSRLMKRSIAGKQDGPPHVVPLATQAKEILVQLGSHTRSGKYMFPSLTSSQRCMSENTVRSALRRLGYTNDEMTPHGFRATARTMAAERLGIDPEVIEAQLAHAVGDALGRAYNRTQYLDQRVQLMQRWADYLDELRDKAQQHGVT